MPNASWAAALGAALQSGSNTFGEAKQQQFNNDRLIANDKQQRDQQQLQMALLRYNLQQQPKQEAAARAQTLLSRDGVESAYNNPQFLRDNEIMGTPLPTRSVQGVSPWNNEEYPAHNATEAAQQGLSPDTGAVLPQSYLLSQATLKKQQAALTAALAGRFGEKAQTAAGYRLGTGENIPGEALKGPQYGFTSVSNGTGLGSSLFRTNPDDGTAQRIGGGSGGQGGGSLSESSTVTGEDFLKTLNPARRRIVEQMLDYRGPNYTGISLSKPDVALLLQQTVQADPTFDLQQYPQRAAMRKSFTSGRQGDSLRKLEALTGHMAQLKDEAQALNNGSFTLANKVGNWFNQQTGDPRVTKYETTAGAVESELAAFLKGAGATDQEIAHWRERFANAQSPEQFDSLFSALGDLVETQAGAFQKQYEDGMGSLRGFAPFGDQAKQSLERLRGPRAGQPEQTQQPYQQAPAAPAGRPRILSITEIK